MCVIIHKPKNIEISESILHQCWFANRDGAGVMFAENGKLVVQKGLMKYKTFLYYLDSINWKEKELIIHLRLGTSGTLSKALTHPFSVNENLAFVHNGCLKNKYINDHICDTNPVDENFSDTYLFNELILKKLPENFTENIAILELLTTYIHNSVLVFMDNEGSIKIVGNYGNPMIKEGCWFSNDVWYWDKHEEFKNIFNSV